MQFDVAIVGFGPTGASLANLLGRDGIRTLVIERAPEVYTLPRAVHFDHEVMRIFQSMGLAEKILPHTGPVTGYVFKNGEGQTLIEIELTNAITSQGWQPDYMFHQPSLERLLREGAEAHESVEVRLGQELLGVEQDDGGVTLRVRDATTGEQSEIRSRYAVGCDGASSPTREAVGLRSHDLEFDEPWLVVDATVDRPIGELDFPQMCLQFCDPKRPTTVLPIVHPYIRWEFMLKPGEGLEMQEPDRVRELVADWIDPAQVEIIRSAVYRFHALVAEQWRRGRVLIAGDAAHQMPPFLGQGMCAGIRDAANLAWKLRLAVLGHADERIFDSYGEERAPHVRQIIETAVAVGHIICTQDEDIAKARDERILNGDGAGLGGADDTQMGPPLPGLASGVLEPEPRHAATGELALQARVRDPEGREGRLDDLVGPGFTLLCRGAPPALDEAAARLADELGIRLVSFDQYVDHTGSYKEWFDKIRAQTVVVRPDHAIFGAATGARSANALLHDLADALR